MANLNSGSRSGASTIITYRMLLDAIKTIDGSGSGIDADMLDGHHADYFSPSTHLHDSRYVLKSGDTMTGRLSFSTGAAISTDVTTPFQIGYSNTHGGATISSYARIKIMANTDNGADEPIQLVTGNGLNVDETKGLLIYKEDIKYNNNRVWHAGNQGHGSGMNADMVDGVDGANIVYGNNIAAVGEVNDLNTIYKSGFYDINTTNNTPTNNNWHWVLNVGHRNNHENYNFGMQLAAPNGTDELYFRTRQVDGTGNWGRVYTTRYKPTPTEIGAVNKAGDTMSGPLKFEGTNYLSTDASTTFQIGEFSNASYGMTSWAPIKILANTDQDSNNDPIQLASGEGMDPSGEKGLVIDRTNLNFYGNKVWHAGNQGSGSGMDADSVDGIEASRIVYGDNASAASPVDDLNTLWKSGFYDITNGRNAPPGNPSGGWYWVINSGHRNNSNNTAYGMQIAGSNEKAELFFRNRTYDGSGNWNRVWNSGNQGDGSGMDSDMVDGYHTSIDSNGNTLVARDGNSNINVNSVTTNSVKINQKVTIQYNNDNNAIEFIVI